MANKAIRDEAADRANERYPEDFRRNWAYSVAYEELVNRYRKAASRGAVHRGPGSRAEEDERIYWRQVARIVNEKLEELDQGGSCLVPEQKVSAWLR